MKFAMLIMITIVTGTFGVTAYDFVMPNVELSVKVVDENEAPISGADVGASFPHVYGAGAAYKGEEKHGITDAQGIALFKGKTAATVGFAVIKNGYYRTQGEQIDFMSLMREGKALKIERKAVLKRIVNPIPMSARRFDTQSIPLNTPCGYDLEISDWVAPLGKGKISDIIFSIEGKYDAWNDYNADLKVTFPNKGDGIVIFEGADNKGSFLRSDYQAPADGYSSVLTLTKARKPDQMSPSWVDSSNEGSNYYLRVRTIMDGNGIVQRANYGKIYGRLEFGRYEGSDIYLKAEAIYFNPTPNDRNVEFDPKRNLVRDLKVGSRVTLP